MTSTYSLFKSLTRPKIRMMNRILLIDVIAIVLTILYQVYRGALGSESPVADTLSYAFVVGFAAFVLLSRNSEHIFVSDAYRLIPASDTKLYSVNLLSSFIGIVYTGIVQAVLVFVTTIPFWNDVMKSLKEMAHYTADKPHFFSQMIYTGTGGLVLAIAATILMWTSITLIHLTGKALTAFLPDTRQKFFRFILYVVVVVAFLYVSSIVANRVNGVIDHFFNLNGDTIASLYYATIYLLGFAAVESVGSVYLLKHWVETGD
ncbi:hypothetical protein [Lentilactobacillus kefiri]|uniref:Uncharacterized protein n=2 Tax=Lentilactobacillus kefiri TaxID=33962 RepID=A0A511DTT1_LENKE|nr:hypothetical protein [Lentilactobacillus kefiri]MCJ2161335.1 ABC transporter permease [Lentilactobacillus kefiri]MCP9368818.1 ABC transporter permease [Lentilactobacillus kefiri]MDH5108849.1 ABC transporter permease [Lentilactobacillus kefiri]MDM7492465.1 ABC transporter permease [Lentilactobacillus kefiri]PAK59455.1 ABC transporter permease [Lentilactobacillus kefiri]